MIDVSVVIPVYNGERYIREQMAALAEQVTDARWELVIADNGSTDRSRLIATELAATFPVPVKVIDASARPGAAYARNRGASEASGSVLAFCDCDDWVAPNWIDVAWQAAQDHAVVAGAVMFPDGGAMNPEVLTSPTARHIMSGNFAIQADAFDQLGGFDSDLPRYAAEDMDFSRTLREHGISIHSAPEMRITFRESPTLRELMRKVYLNGKGEVLITQKREGRLPSRADAFKAWASIPVFAASTLGFPPEPGKVKQVGREAIRRTGHLVGRLEIDEAQQASRPTGASMALWVTPVSDIAGVARHVLDVAAEGIPGWQLEVAAPDGALLKRLRDMDVNVHPIALDSNPAKAARDLRALIEELKPQIVHSHLAKADLLLAAAGEGLPTKRVSSEHGIAADARLYNKNAAMATVKRRLHRIRCNRFDHLIAVSESTKEQMLKAWQPKTPITVVLNGVDRPTTIERQLGKRYLSLSRLSHEKNIAAIVEAFAELDEDSTLTIAGDGPDKAEIEAQIHQLGLTDRVSLPGFVDAAKALAAHDVLVQLSKWENASYSLLDAVVHGLGVVATPVGGNPEILPERCLVEASNTYEVARLMREQIERENRPTLPDHWPTVAEMTEQIAAVYDEVWR